MTDNLRADARQNHARLLAAANEAFAETGASAPLEEIARRAGVGIGTLYRHFPTRLDLQAAVFRDQVMTLCSQADSLVATHAQQAQDDHPFIAWTRSLSSYFAVKRGLSKALIEGLGRDSEVVTTCWSVVKETTERLLTDAQQAGVIRADVNAIDVMRLLHGVSEGTQKAPEDAPRLTAVVVDGLRARHDRSTAQTLQVGGAVLEGGAEDHRGAGRHAG